MIYKKIFEKITIYRNFEENGKRCFFLKISLSNENLRFRFISIMYI